MDDNDHDMDGDNLFESQLLEKISKMLQPITGQMNYTFFQDTEYLFL